MSVRFSQTLTAGREDLDEQGHVNNVSYVRWVQDAAVSHWLSAAPREIVEQTGWVLIRHELDYKNPSFENDQILVTTWVGSWTRVTCERFVEITRDGVLLVSSRTVWCMLDRELSKPKRITAEIKQLFSN